MRDLIVGINVLIFLVFGIKAIKNVVDTLIPQTDLVAANFKLLQAIALILSLSLIGGVTFALLEAFR